MHPQVYPTLFGVCYLKQVVLGLLLIYISSEDVWGRNPKRSVLL